MDSCIVHCRSRANQCHKTHSTSTFIDAILGICWAHFGHTLDGILWALRAQISLRYHSGSTQISLRERSEIILKSFTEHLENMSERTYIRRMPFFLSIYVFLNRFPWLGCTSVWWRTMRHAHSHCKSLSKHKNTCTSTFVRIKATLMLVGPGWPPISEPDLWRHQN